MIKIGIIGDIGSGKTFISRQFGYPVFNADQEVENIYKKNRNLFYKLKKKLPNFLGSFPVKKKELKAAVLNNKKNLKIIEKIIHPEVQKKLKKFTRFNKKKKILIFDIPLLLEKGIYKKNFVLVFVDAKKKDIDKNLKKRKNYNEKVIENLRKLQISTKIKKKKSNFIIRNNFKRSNIKKSVKILLREVLKK